MENPRKKKRKLLQNEDDEKEKKEEIKPRWSKKNARLQPNKKFITNEFLGKLNERVQKRVAKLQEIIPPEPSASDSGSDAEEESDQDDTFEKPQEDRSQHPSFLNHTPSVFSSKLESDIGFQTKIRGSKRKDVSPKKQQSKSTTKKTKKAKSKKDDPLDPLKLNFKSENKENTNQLNLINPKQEDDDIEWEDCTNEMEQPQLKDEEDDDETKEEGGEEESSVSTSTAQVDSIKNEPMIVNEGKKEEEEDDYSTLKNLMNSSNLKTEKTIIVSLEGTKKKRGVTKVQKEASLEFHKAHLVTLIIHVLYTNHYLNDSTLQSVLYSLVPGDKITTFQDDVVYKQALEDLMKWFRSQFTVVNRKTDDDNEDLSLLEFEPIEEYSRKRVDQLLKAIDNRILNQQQVMVAMLRSIGMSARFVTALNPAPLKVSLSETSPTKDTSPKKDNAPLYNWVEVYASLDFRWIQMNPINGTVDSPLSTEDKKYPFTYVIGIDNDNFLRDVTRRYVAKWTACVPRRVPDESWLRQTLRVLSPPLNKRSATWKQRDEEEQAELERAEKIEKFPTSQEGFRRHPLYCLEKFLNKYQMIHPKEPLGDFKGQPIYSRSCIQELHTMEKWLQFGRVIKAGEEPIRKVKKKVTKKRDDSKDDSNKQSENEPQANLYGYWQTELYVPPKAVDGKVPKNQYGNVYLFQPHMLPGGTMHVQINGIAKLCKKLGIDYANAVVDWEFHNGRCVPKLDGIVVCTENALLVEDMWEQEQQNKKRDKELKKQRRVLERWKRMVKGVLIRHSLQQKYDAQSLPPSERISTSNSSATHQHEFPKENHVFDEKEQLWRKTCSCGFSVTYEQL